MSESDLDRSETLQGLVSNDPNEIGYNPEKQLEDSDVTPIKVKSSIPIESFPVQSEDSSSYTDSIARSSFENLIEEVKEKTEDAQERTYPEIEMGIILKGEHERAARSKRGDLMNIPSSEAEQKNIKMGEGGDVVV